MYSKETTEGPKSNLRKAAVVAAGAGEDYFCVIHAMLAGTANTSTLLSLHLPQASGTAQLVYPLSHTAPVHPVEK